MAFTAIGHDRLPWRIRQPRNLSLNAADGGLNPNDMKFIDRNGDVIGVENLALAINEADNFRNYKVDNPLPSDLERYAY